MDLRTGKTYENFEEAQKDGVPVSDIAFVEQTLRADGVPVVRFTKGSFKNYIRNSQGILEQVKS